MAETYWISFTIRDKTTPRGTYDQRREALIDALFEVKDGWWPETTSFVLFGTEKTTSQLVALIKAAIDPTVDIALLGMAHKKTMRQIGGDAQGFTVLESLVDFAVRS